MNLRKLTLTVLSALLVCPLGSALGSDAQGPARAAAYVHSRVREGLRARGPQRVVVVMGHPSLPNARARDWRRRPPAVAQLADRVTREIPRFRVLRRYEISPYLAGIADRQSLRKLARSPYVEAVYPDRRVEAVLAESGPLIGQPVVEGEGYDGTGVSVAVLDTGIDYTHPDLGGSPDEGAFPNAKVVGGYDYVNSDGLPMDDDGHGTYVAGIAAGTGSTYRGIAPGADLVALKVLDNEGLGWSSDIIAAIDWCIQHRSDYNIKAINLSLADAAEWRDPDECEADPEGQKIADAVDNGIVVVAAAGNEAYTHGIGLPACAASAIAVGATWDSGTSVDTPASFTNRGELIELYAPGSVITSTRWEDDPFGSGLYVGGQGTSAATPHVAGAVAILAQMGITDPATIRSRLARTGVQIVDAETGTAAPRIDLERAWQDEPSSGPDLVVTQVEAAVTSALVGAVVDVGITITNQGDAASGTCTAVLALSANRIASPQDEAMATVTVPPLAPAETYASGTVSGTVPGVSPGDYWVVGFADSDYTVAERDETNNGSLGDAFNVDSLSSYVTSSEIPAFMVKGETYSVSVTIQNAGTRPWTSADGVALRAVSPEGTTRWGVSQVPLPGGATVEAGGTVEFSFDVTAPSQIGWYPCHWRLARGDIYFGEIATGATKTRVVDDAQWGQQNPALDGDWVVYQDYRVVQGYAAAIGVENTTTGAAVTIPDDIAFPTQWDPTQEREAYAPPYQYFDISSHVAPDIAHPWVAWMVDDVPDNPTDPLSEDTFWYYQVAAQNAERSDLLPLRLTEQEADAWFPAVDGTLVVWEDYRYDSDGIADPLNFLNDESDIFIADLSDVTGPSDHYPQVYPLCTAPGPQLVPRISYPYVIWEDWRDPDEDQSDLYLYDLSVDTDGDGTPNWKDPDRPDPDPAETQLTDTWWPEEFPDISGETVVWMDLQRDPGTASVIDLYIRELDSPTRTAVATDPPAYRQRPRIAGTNVVWEDWRQGQADVYWWDISAAVGGPIAASPAAEEWPDISGTRVSYAKHRLTRDIEDPQGWPEQYKVYNIWIQDLLTNGSVGVCSFLDAPNTFWAWQHVEAAVANGVVQGYPDGTYQPGLIVTRDQMAVYIARALAGGDSAVPPGPAEPTFTDVSGEHWAYDYIEYCAAPAQDVVAGYEDGSYQPANPVTRGQMAAYIARAMAGGDGFFDGYTPAGPATFPDVPEDEWNYGYVEYIAQAEVTQGYPDGLYHPEVECSRDQMAVYVSRAFDYLD